MKVLRLFVNTESDRPPLSCSKLDLEQNYGIVGDHHAAVGSPRQVLLVDQPCLERFGLQPGDLYENVLVDGAIAPWQSGQVWQMGQARVRLTFLCEPCAYLETLRPGLVRQMQGQRGWLGLVVGTGAIAVGDRVTLMEATYPPLSEVVWERFTDFVARIPVGKVVTTADLVLALGVTRSYYRVFPGFMKKALATLPVHRIVAMDGSLFSQHVPHQAEWLAREGTTVTGGKVGDRDRWQPEYFYPP